MQDNKFPPISLENISHIIKGSPSVLILCHTNPDGDAVGSSCALAEIIRKAGGTARCVSPDALQERLRFLIDDMDTFRIEQGEEKNYDIVCSVDTASPEQLGTLISLADSVDFMIDHHESGTPYAPHYIDSSASATGEIIFRLYKIMIREGIITPSPEICRRIYAAILSDTGSFKYSNVTPDTHLVAAELVREINAASDGGLATDEISRALFSQRTMKDLTCQMISIQNLKLFLEGKLGVVLLLKEQMMSVGLTEGDTGLVVEIPRSLAGVKVALSVRQSFTDPKKFKVSSRSNCDVNVAEVCSQLKGGGHAKAAGCTIYADSPEDALNIAVEAFTDAVLLDETA